MPWAPAREFVAAVADSRVEVDGTMQPAAFSQAMINAFRAERCVKCHTFHYEDGTSSELRIPASVWRRSVGGEISSG